MAQAARQAMTIAPRLLKPTAFPGTDVAWRVLCDLYPNAESTEIVVALYEYCAAKRLDPFKRPVHIVPMYNSKLRRRVQTVMQGINEIETTASRSGKWAGMDIPVWGPEIDRTFRGTIESDDGSTAKVEKTLRFPLWCTVTVYKLIGNQRCAFAEQLFWEECYASAGFRTEVPNERWSKAPHQMLHKCTKAAVLRAAFPEEGLGYAAEEMEDQQTPTGGITIEGKIDHGDPGLTERDRHEPSGKEAATPPGDPLDESHGTKWLANLHARLNGASTVQEVVELRRDPRVVRVMDDPVTNTPTLIKRQIEDAFRDAHVRLAPAADDGASADAPMTWEDDPIQALLMEIAGMDAISIAGLDASAEWRARVRDAAPFPPDQDRLKEAIEARKLSLQRNAT